MTKKEKKKILDWIFESHEHHRDINCVDSDYPYVNSIELERFINEL